MPKLLFKNSQTVHIIKTISYRILGSVATFLAALLFTGEVAVSLAIGGVEAMAKMFLYYAHERLWFRFTDLKPAAETVEEQPIND